MDHGASSSDFASAYRHGFARVAACTLPVAAGDPARNAEAIVEQVRLRHAEGVAVALFPELSLSGYAIDDLLLQDVLLDEVDRAVVPSRPRPGRCCRWSSSALPCATATGCSTAPSSSTAARSSAWCRSRTCPTTASSTRSVTSRPATTPAATGSTRRMAGRRRGGRPPVRARPHLRGRRPPGLAVHVEICEDMWVPVPPSAKAALAGATVLLNLSASPITVGRADDRHLLARSASSRCNAAYLYAAASAGESTTDLSWDGMTMVYEMGDLLGESERFPQGAQATVVDVDLDRLRQERIRQGSFDDNRRAERVDASDGTDFRTLGFALKPPSGDIGLRRKVDRFPFVPDDEARLALDCYEAYNIQVSGLEQRLRAIATDSWQPKIVIGVSGGLDSTHALIVAAKAMDRLGRPRTDVIGFTMPGFATSAGTKSNAVHLMESLGITWEELDIRPAATQMLKDLGHPFGRGEEVYDVTFENVQAGLRTDYLFRAANQRGGIVLGTGDLSELALGWCTYGVGDQMSHYGVNSGVPKTLMQHLIRWVVSSGQFEPTGRGQRHAHRDPRPGDQSRAGPHQGGREDPVHRGLGRSLRVAGLHALPRAAPGLPAEQDRLPRDARVVRCRHRRVAGGLPREPPHGIRPRHDPALDGGLRAALLHQPVQAVRATQRSQSRCRRLTLASW